MNGRARRSPTALKNPKPLTVAFLAAREKIVAACLGEWIRITSSVRVMVTSIALGSLNNLAKRFLLAESFLALIVSAVWIKFLA